MLPSVCSVIDHRGRQNVVRTSVAHEAIAESIVRLYIYICIYIYIYIYIYTVE